MTAAWHDPSDVRYLRGLARRSAGHAEQHRTCLHQPAPCALPPSGREIHDLLVVRREKRRGEPFLPVRHHRTVPPGLGLQQLGLKRRHPLPSSAFTLLQQPRHPPRRARCGRWPAPWGQCWPDRPVTYWRDTAADEARHAADFQRALNQLRWPP